jgi:hypothetical protein
MDRDEFFAQLGNFTPKEIEARLSSWDREELALVQEYLAIQDKPPQAAPLARGQNRMDKVVTERTVAAALIALGLVIAALIVRGGYEVSGSSLGAYVVNRFTGATWQCIDVCVRIETFFPDKKK